MINIKILGKGCPKCKKMEERVIRVAEELGVDYKIEKVSDINEVTGYGVMLTPALVVDEEVRISGRIPKNEELKKILSSN